jgi:hypothetical protein
MKRLNRTKNRAETSSFDYLVMMAMVVMMPMPAPVMFPMLLVGCRDHDGF